MISFDKYIYTAKLIFNKLSGRLHEKEQNEFDSWISEKSENKSIYSNFSKGLDLSKEQKFYNKLDSNIAFKRVNSLIKKQKRIRIYYKISSYAAAIMIPVLLFVFIDKTNFINSHNLSSTQKKEIKKDVATITTSTGERIELATTGKDSIKLDNGSTIIRNGTNLLLDKKLAKASKTIINTLNIPRGGIFHIILPDGTKVWLNADSKFKFPSDFTGKKRIVELDGEAFFDVAKDKKHPFIVKSGEHHIKVLGTKFNIRAYKEDLNIITTLESGKVSIITNGKLAGTLKPKQKSVYNRISRKVRISNASIKNILAWLNGYWYFNGERLEGIMNRLSRWYNVDVFFRNKDIRDIKIVGRFRKSRNIKEILNSIEITSPVRFEQNKKAVIVKMAP